MTSRVLRTCLAIALLAPASLPGEPASRPSVDVVPPASVPVSVVRSAMAFLGVPYSPGGDTRNGMDCSGFVSRVFTDSAGISLPRSVTGLFGAGIAATSPIHIGDLLFFDTSGRGSLSVPTHVGIYTGRDRFVHAASEGGRTGVIVSSLKNPYYSERFLRARRVIEWRPPVLAITLTNAPQQSILENPFASRETLRMMVSSKMTGGGLVELTLLREGKEILMQRIAPTARKASELTILPDVGEWTLRVNRLYRGRELLSVTFRVEE